MIIEMVQLHAEWGQQGWCWTSLEHAWRLDTNRFRSRCTLLANVYQGEIEWFPFYRACTIVPAGCFVSSPISTFVGLPGSQSKPCQSHYPADAHPGTFSWTSSNPWRHLVSTWYWSRQLRGLHDLFWPVQPQPAAIVQKAIAIPPETIPNPDRSVLIRPW